MQISLTKSDYISLKAMFNATGGVPDRQALFFVHYNHQKQEFVATNGQILVIKPLSFFAPDLFESLPEKSFSLEKSQFGLMTSAIHSLVNTIVINESLQEENPYPDYSSILTGEDLIHPVKEIGIDFDLVGRFCKSFPGRRKNQFNLAFCGPLGGIRITWTDGADTQIFVGLIMPIKIVEISKEEETND